MQSTLFDAEFMRKLETLRLLARKVFRGQSQNDRTTLRRGMGLEFSDYRRYHAGDDFRYIDWNVYSRLDRLFLKIFTAEEDLTIHLLVDTSRSMQVGTPPKLDYARRIAAALGYIGLNGLDRVGAVSFADELGRPMPPQRGRQQIFALFKYFEDLPCQGSTDLNRVLSNYARQSAQGGLAIVLSDLLDAHGYARGLDALAYGRFDVLVIQLVDETELYPPFDGALRLQDIESTQQRRLTVNRRLLERYRQKVLDYFNEIETFCARRNIEYLRASTTIPFEDVVLRYLRRGFYLQ
ncbi:MAG: DUF58 domain-containing protein [Candidatus Tectomicrobia bacterium]|uniref:DUF58 domain-containing protein n=1 Tax=Tectimicrobiota bacterium TaxID=2528274 RepID=A0A938B128_UNCTE|nr:DUF58 domain-containing protein [Candidatus Tectomicrobia bacterium]